jgi:hypothetical protein
MICPLAAFPGKEHWPLGQLRLFIGGDLVDARTDGFKLSLKLYHWSELRLGYQQSIAEAPGARQLANIKKAGHWGWQNNPFKGTREFHGLVVMMSLLNNWDLKTPNNDIYQNGQEYQYLVILS